ncbi:MAG: hypothetical protein II951_12110 [Bacteroidales bacterium]|nr:hypothetical protein [Bacteroidales bacterium]
MKSVKSIVMGVVSAAVLAACGTGNAKTEEAAPSECIQGVAITTDSLLTVAEGLVGDTVYVRGYVRHVCKHSGKKCFISDKERKMQIRVTAGGEIGGFNKELIGSEIAVKGILKENRISKEDLEKAEQEIEAEKAQGDASKVQTCETELSDIAAKKAFMDLKGLGYYPDYYVAGLDFVECAAGY